MGRAPVAEADVTLVPGAASAKAVESEAAYWHVFVQGKRAGHVHIRPIDLAPIGKHASLDIHINQKDRGKHIGRIAYQLAVQQSSFDTVYAHMSKSNLASKQAAQYAGFQVVDDPGLSQLTMVWHRPPTAT